jgi:hypothetical protein
VQKQQLRGEGEGRHISGTKLPDPLLQQCANGTICRNDTHALKCSFWRPLAPRTP